MVDEAWMVEKGESMYDILLVEDQEDLADLLSIFIEKEGYTVIRAASGEEALSRLKENDIKLLILDITLPGMDS